MPLRGSLPVIAESIVLSVVIASIFFWVVDTGLGFAFRYIIALGS